SKNLIDPDGGINLENKRRELGLQEEQDTATLVDFPTKGFVVGINTKLHVGYPQIWKFLIDDEELKKQLSMEKPIVKGYNFYKLGKVQGIYTKQQEELFYIKSQIKAVEDKTGRKIGLHYIIPQQVPEYSTTVTEETPQTSKWDIVSPIKTAPLSMLDIAQKSLRSKTRLYDSIKDRNDITEATKEQHLTRTWYDVRKPRITASKCKRCLIRPTTSPTKAISEVLIYNDRAPTKAMKKGIEAESRIISEFEKDTGLTVHKSGFVISETHPFLGASPDGIIDNHTIVEVKNIQVKEGESHEDAMCRLGIYKKNGSAIEINKNHGYYHQIQQQLFCTQSNSCHFIVSSAISTHREVITFDSGFWNDILPKLESFYFNHLFPELVYPRIFHGEMRWNKVLEFPRSL
ncbi:unnamed protein product, partial [Pocillopora meandrina]